MNTGFLCLKTKAMYSETGYNQVAETNVYALHVLPPSKDIAQTAANGSQGTRRTSHTLNMTLTRGAVSVNPNSDGACGAN